MSQARIPHHSCNRGAMQAFGTNTLGSIFHNLLTDLRFMLRPVTHNY